MRRFRISSKIALAMVLLVFLAHLALAQTFRGRVEGIVTDQSKAVISAANATLTNVNTNVKVVRQTSDTGLYVFDSVDPGTYSVTIEVAGFNKLSRRTSWCSRAATSR